MGGIIRTTSPTAQDVRLRQLQIAAALAVAQPTVLKTVLFDSQAQLTALYGASVPASAQIASDCKLTAAMLPALVGLSVGAVTDGTPNVNRQVTRNYLWLVLFYQLCDASAGEQLAAQAAAASLIHEMPDYMASVGRLKFGDSGLRGVADVLPMTDNGIDNPITWLGATYQHVFYTLPVITSR